jgi:hypothetical protein
MVFRIEERAFDGRELSVRADDEDHVSHEPENAKLARHLRERIVRLVIVNSDDRKVADADAPGIAGRHEKRAYEQLLPLVA